jgi:predicted transposase YdaD
MSSKVAAFEQALADAGWVAKWKAEGEARGEAEGKLEVAKNLLDNVFSVEQTAQYAKIDIEKVRALRQETCSDSIQENAVKSSHTR